MNFAKSTIVISLLSVFLLTSNNAFSQTLYVPGGNTGISNTNSGNDNVGIGQNDPSYKLHVNGIIRGRDHIAVEKDGAYRVAMNGLQNGYIVGRNDQDEIKFYLHSNGNTFFMGGRVGVGVSSPAAALEVKTTEGDGGEILRLSSERAWAFKQDGTGSATCLVLQDLSGGKIFKINSYDGVNSFSFAPTDGRSYFKSNMLIGKTYEEQTNHSYLLDVNGKIRGNEIVVNTTGADFVFGPEYNLPSLEEVERYIQKNQHLPEIPSAKQMQEEGMAVGELNTKLLQKVEELTLYIIQLNQKVEVLSQENENLSDQVMKLENRND